MLGPKCSSAGGFIKTLFEIQAYRYLGANKDVIILKFRSVIMIKMADVSDTTVNSDIFVDDVKTVMKAIKESKKRPDEKAIWQYLSNKLASNMDEDYTGELINDFVSKKMLLNKHNPKATHTRQSVKVKTKLKMMWYFLTQK